MTDSGGFAIGARRGLEGCASPRGTFTVLALDHRQNLRKEISSTDPDSVTYEAMVEYKRAVVRMLAPQATGTLLDPEVGAAADRIIRMRDGLVLDDRPALAA